MPEPERDRTRNRPLDAQVTPRFAGPTTFLRLPIASAPAGLDVAIAGVPFDCGASYRPGARFGPRAVREISALLRPYNRVLGVDPFDWLNVADLGDVCGNPLDTSAMLDAVRDHVAGVVRAGAIPLTVGGDHTIALGTLRGVRAALGRPVALVQIDAHLDTWESYFGDRYTHGTFLRRAIEEGVVDGARSIQVGIRGPLFGPDDLANNTCLGLEVVPIEQIAARTLADLSASIRERAGDGPVYVTLDIDSVDPAFAPGTGTPEVGGLTSREVIQIVQGLVGLHIVGADVVEVAPAYDPAQVTALLAARLLHEFLSVFALNHVSARPHIESDDL